MMRAPVRRTAAGLRSAAAASVGGQPWQDRLEGAPRLQRPTVGVHPLVPHERQHGTCQHGDREVTMSSRPEGLRDNPVASTSLTHIDGERACSQSPAMPSQR